MPLLPRLAGAGALSATLILGAPLTAGADDPQDGPAVAAEFCFESAPFPSCHASTIVEVEPGTLLVAYFAGTGEGNVDVGIWTSRGTARPDGSTSWEPPQLVHDEPGVPCWNPVLFRPKGGDLLLFFKAGPSPQTWSGFLRRSADGGKSWSDAAILPAGILGPVRSKPIEDAQGRLICGSSVESYNAWGCWVEITPDRGATWGKHGPINVPEHPHGIIQASVFPIADGKLGLLARSRGIGRLCRSESADGGATWTPAEPIDMPNPNAGADATRLADGRLALICNPVAHGRTPLVVAVSDDDGKTFDIRLTLEDGPGEYSYPALIQAADGRIHCSYTWRRQRIKHAAFDLSALDRPEPQPAGRH